MVEPTCGHDVAETRRVEGLETAYEGTGAANAQVATAAGGATTGRALARCEESPLHCAGRTERARRHVQAQGRRARTATLWPRSDIWHHVIISYGRRVQPELDGRSARKAGERTGGSRRKGANTRGRLSLEASGTGERGEPTRLVVGNDGSGLLSMLHSSGRLVSDVTGLSLTAAVFGVTVSFTKSLDLT